jgi:hypothetical protein
MKGKEIYTPISIMNVDAKMLTICMKRFEHNNYHLL